MKKIVLPLALLLLAAAAFADNLIDAVVANDLALVRKKVELLDLSLADEPYCAMYLASTKSFEPVMWKYLLDHNADVNMADNNGIAPVHWAIVRSDQPALDAVIAAEANLGATVDIQGLSEQRSIISSYLFNQNSDVEINLRESRISSLALSVLTGNLQAVLALSPRVAIKESGLQGLNISILDLPYYNPNGYGSRNEDRQFLSPTTARILQVLLREAEKLPAEDRPEVTPDLRNWVYYLAIDDVASFKKILATATGENQNMIPYSVMLGAKNCLDLLLKLSDLGYSSAVSYSMELPYGQTSRDSKNPLYAFALLSGNLDMLRVFAEKKTDFNRPMTYTFQRVDETVSRTEPALIAALRMLPGTAVPEFLIANGVDVNVKSSSGAFPLHLAVDTGTLAQVKALLAAKADPNVMDSDGNVPSYWAVVYSKKLDFLTALQASKAKLDVVDKNGFGLVHGAALSGNTDILRFLVEKKAPYWLKSKNGVDWDKVSLSSGMTALDMAKAMRDSSERESVKTAYQAVIDYLAKLPAPPAKK